MAGIRTTLTILAMQQIRNPLSMLTLLQRTQRQNRAESNISLAETNAEWFNPMQVQDADLYRNSAVLDSFETVVLSKTT